MAARNVVVAQSGGPTCVINNSLARHRRDLPPRIPKTFGTVYARAFRHRGRAQGRADRPVGDARRRDRAAAHLAGGRQHRHLPLQAQEGAGPRTSTASSTSSRPTTSATSSTSAATTRRTRPTRSSELAHERGLDLVAIGVPKTIDNDLGDAEFKLLDHSPGYGSVGPVLRAVRPPGQRGERRLLPGRPGAGDPGDGPQDRLHPGRRPAGRPASARCRSRST